MLIHQAWESEGAGQDSVVLANRTVLGEDFGYKGSAFAGYVFGSTGQGQIKTEDGGLQNVVGEWLAQGTASDYYLRYNIFSGTLDQNGGTEDTWIQLNSTLSFWVVVNINGSQTCVVDYEIASDVSGSPIVATARHTYTAFVEGF